MDTLAIILLFSFVGHCPRARNARTHHVRQFLLEIDARDILDIGRVRVKRDRAVPVVIQINKVRRVVLDHVILRIFI